jgi:hypothetical protein
MQPSLEKDQELMEKLGSVCFDDKALLSMRKTMGKFPLGVKGKFETDWLY